MPTECFCRHFKDFISARRAVLVGKETFRRYLPNDVDRQRLLAADQIFTCRDLDSCYD